MAITLHAKEISAKKHTTSRAIIHMAEKFYAAVKDKSTFRDGIWYFRNTADRNEFIAIGRKIGYLINA